MLNRRQLIKNTTSSLTFALLSNVSLEIKLKKMNLIIL